MGVNNWTIQKCWEGRVHLRDGASIVLPAIPKETGKQIITLRDSHAKALSILKVLLTHCDDRDLDSPGFLYVYRKAQAMLKQQDNE